MATMSEETRTESKVPIDSETRGLKKRVKQKGATHALRWEILDNKDVKAEEGWEAQLQEFWTSKTCKNFVKMCHISKLWPRECHQSHTRDFACRPWLCNDDHFLHRAEEVWRALFGDRPKSKGLFNYSLLSMVYSELILNQKVDWSTFPTTAEFPLGIARGQKHIPDLYNPGSVETKSLLEKMKNPRGQTVTGVVSRKVVVPKKVDVPKKIEVPKKLDVPSTSGALQPKMDNMVSKIISTMFPTSQVEEEENQNHKTDEDFVDDRSGGGEDNVIQQRADENVKMVEVIVPDAQILQSTEQKETIAGPSSAVPTRLEPNCKASTSTMEVVRVIQEMIQEMPTKAELMGLLDFSIQVANYETTNEDDSEAQANEGESRPMVDAQTTAMREVIQLACNLKDGALLLSSMSPHVADIARVFTKITSSIVAAAHGFDKLSGYIGPLLEGRVEDLETIMKLEKRQDQQKVLISEMVKELDDYKKKGKSVATERPPRMQERRKKDLDVPVYEVDKVDVQSPSQSSDCLVLSKYEAVVVADRMAKTAKIPSQPSQVGQEVEIGWSEIQSEALGKEEVILPTEKDMESVLQELEVAKKERDAARAELESLRRTFAMVDDIPSHENVMPWLAWVHRLQDRETMVSKASNSLKKDAARSNASRELLEASLERFKNTSAKGGRERTECTVWGDVVEMMDRTNYHRKGMSKDVDWTLEVEEGWVPYNIFSSHFMESERTVIHTCDPRPTFLDDKCSLCQEHFGPEGAYTLGQCGHKFHITCICRSSMRQSICPMCRSPISTRFYEMMGLRDVMPPGHEFNRWNLPLDQLPKKFLNYREWGKPLTWNTEFSCHQLYEEYGMERDSFFWMTQDYEVEIRAREIEDVEQRELFCRNFGGHWSIEHKRFFRFPPKKVERGEDGSWHEVEGDIVWGEEYKKYNRTLVGRALFLAKLEEAAKLRSSIQEASFEDVGCCYWDAVQAFDRRIGDVIENWRSMLWKPEEVLMLSFEENDKFIKKLVGRVEKAMEVLAAKRVDRGGKRKREDASDSDNSWESQMQRQIAATDQEYAEGGRIARPSQRAQTRSATMRQRMNEASGSGHPMG